MCREIEYDLAHEVLKFTSTPIMATAVLFWGSLAPFVASAQNVSCSLSGTVQDPTGASLPDIEVVLTNSQTGFISATKTTREGFFFASLTPGTFSLDIAAPGYRSYRETGIDVGSGEQRPLGVIRLKLSEVAESVTVTADPSHVKLASGERSSIITGADLSTLAIRAGDVMDAVALLPGVVDASNGREVASSQSMVSIYIAGGRSNQKNMTVDGITNLDSGSNNSVQTMPSWASIAEVQVLQSNYAAEYGRNSGGSITVITKSGSRVFHGLAAWSHRHEEFSANDFFNNQAGKPRSRYRYNIFDYSLGGPLYIPRVFNRDRSRLFFFFSQEYEEQLFDYGPKKVRVPTQLERSGDFSQTFDVNRKLIVVHDPLNKGTAFPGNRIPATRFNAAGQNVLRLLPLPNYTDPYPSNLYQWNYFVDASAARPIHSTTARADYSPHPNTQIYARYSKYTEDEAAPYGSGSNWDFAPAIQLQPGWSGTVHATQTFSPTILGEFIFGVSQRKHDNYLQYPDRVTRSAAGIAVSQFNPSANPQMLIPSITFGGITNAANITIANSLPWYVSNTFFSVVHNLSKVVGKHTLKAGVYIERTRKDQSADAPTRGSIAFDHDANNPLDTNYAFASALLGYYTHYSEASARPQGQYRFTNLEWYLQDNWRVTTRLTLDYGVRFYHDPPQYDQRGQISTFVPSLYDSTQAPVLLRPGLDATGHRSAVDPRTGVAYSQGLIATFAPGGGNPLDGIAIGGRNGFPSSLYTNRAVSFGPRFGFAWDPFGRGHTAIRGGAGIFYDRIAGQITMDTLTDPPSVLTPEIFSGTLESLSQIATAPVGAPSTVHALFGHQQPPTVYNFSFGVQHQVGRGTLFDIAYVGSLARHLLWSRDINAVPPGSNYTDLHPENRDSTANKAYPSNLLRPYLGWSDIHADEFAATSNYHSAQFSVLRRVTKGLRLLGSYTFSKALGSADSDGAVVSAFFAPRLRNYGPLSFDRTQVASFSYYYALPKPGERLHLRLLRITADNWELSGITRFSTGGPYTPGISTTDNADLTGTSSESARITIINPDARPAAGMFARTPRNNFGNAGVGILRLPFTQNWDMSLYRRIPFNERITMHLRLETYNTFNHTQFLDVYRTAKFDPSGNQVDPLFLTPSSARGPRRIQLAVRLTW